MITKTYRTKSIAEAVDQIKREMGPRAQIISTRRLTERALLPWKKTSMLQITAHVEERYVSPDQLELLQGMRGVVFTKDDDEKDGVQPVTVNLSSRAQKSGYEERIRQMQSLIDDLKKQIEMMQLNQDEIAFIQKSLSVVDVARHAEASEDACLAMAEFLARQGFSEAYLTHWNRLILRLGKNADADTVFESTAEWVLSLVRLHSAPALPKGLILSGVAGCGVSTMMLKLASEIVQAGGKPILVAAGNTTYRAKRLLRSQAARLKVRVVLAQNPQDLSLVLPRLDSHATVIVDCGGLTGTEVAWWEALSSLQQTPATIWAVASALELSQQQPHISKDAEALLVSHLDAATSIGSLICRLVEMNLPVSYFGIGPASLEDIERATPERLAGLLFDVRENDSTTGSTGAEEMTAFH